MRLDNYKQVFLILSKSWGPELLALYENIAIAAKEYGDCFILFHQSAIPSPERDYPSVVYCFTDNVLSDLGYSPICDSLVPGNNHFPLLKFYLENPVYDFYWCIEDDVAFSGDWRVLFDMAVSHSRTDFISSHIAFYKDQQDWQWWSSFSAPEAWQKDNLVKSFNPIYRISRKAMKLLDFSLRNGWVGHHEVLMPTLFFKNNLNILDIGGDGRFTPPYLLDRFYTKDTFRYRPAFQYAGSSHQKLYHPVKSMEKTLRKKISLCVVCMNRSWQLKYTLQRNIADSKSYPNLEFVLLNYNSQDDMDEWVKSNMQTFIDNGRLVYYRTDQPKVFNHSHAKNLAFKLASGDILCSINADHFTGEGFAEFVNTQFIDNEDVVITPIVSRTSQQECVAKDVLGKVCVSRNAFLSVKGFDERMLSYGFEDLDFVNRLEMIGIKRQRLEKASFLQYISHEDIERFSIEILGGAIFQILVGYVAPSLSKVIFLYHNGEVNFGEIVDNTSIMSEKPEASFHNLDFEFEFALVNQGWEKGKWKRNEKDGCIALSFDSGEESVLIPENSEDGNWIDGNDLLYYIVQDPKLRKDLLDFHYLMKNRILLEHNFSTKNVAPNESGFGRAIVYKNFKEFPITIK